MDLKQILSKMTVEEKAILVTGAASMSTAEIERLGIKPLTMADGPHGVRVRADSPNGANGNVVANCTSFPCLASAGSTWNKELIFELGAALADDCIEQGVDMLLAPGINIKRTPRCGRNFEYAGEDPVHSGEIGAAYINGLQSRGVGASLKHYALNNQEVYRLNVSVEVDLRVMHEIYLKGFKIAIEKSNPYTVMCSYNNVGAIWAAENKYLLDDILKKQWGYEGVVVSDWGAVTEICRSLMAGLDLEMPGNPNIIEQVKAGLNSGALTMEALDNAVLRVLGLVTKERPVAVKPYDRHYQHDVARRVAAEGIVMLKNDNETLPIKREKCKKIGVIGDYAVKPMLGGQGSSEVYPAPEYIDTPLDAIKKSFGDDVVVEYLPIYSQKSFNENMIWGGRDSWCEFCKSCDAVVLFTGSMQSEDSENFDRRTIEINPNVDYVINSINPYCKKLVVVLQSGSSLALGCWKNKVGAILEMWLAGEAAGSALADVLSGDVNPSGKLSETFPTEIRSDIDYPGDGYKVQYNEGFDVGYRYYDKHPEEIAYPFGFGLSYTSFEYRDFDVKRTGDTLNVSFNMANVGKYDGSDVPQIYYSKKLSDVTRCQKDLLAFEKVFLKAGESKRVEILVPIKDLAYYNTMLSDWVVESGEYTLMLAQSSRDIICEQNVLVDVEMPYSTDCEWKQAMVG